MARKAKQRSKGLGCLERKGRVWRARWTVDGKTFTKTTGTSDRREAEKILAEIVAPFAAKSDAERLENLAVKIEGRKAEIRRYEDSKPALALADGFEAYRRSRERPDTGAATLDMYESQYNRLVRWAADNAPDAKEMRNFTRATADTFATYFAGELSANSFNKYITLFRRMWDVLAEEGRMTENPWAKIRHMALATHTRRELTVEELARVCGSVTGEMRLLFAVGIYTGLRLGDCALLEWGAIDLARNRIMTIPRKTARHAHGKPVVIPLHPTLAAMLAEIPPKNRKGYLLPKVAATYLDDDTKLSRRIQAIFTNAGIRTQTTADGERAKVDIGFHSLRHTFVSLSANAGAPLAVVQAIVGHSNPAMTRHYYHESMAALQSAVAALPSISLDGAQDAEKAPAAIPSPVATSEPADGADAPQSRFSAFRDAVRGMTREELERARAEIDRLLATSQQ
jgi:integrase